jgi:2'-hydroxyisoflavone reductase
MKLLVLGGTRFLGRAIVDAALARGHTVSLFNRGQSNGDLYSQLENLRGNRDGDLEALHGKQWDAVIDTCGYVPRIVGMSAELLADAVQQYIFISTISVYNDYSQLGIDENAPVGTLEDETVEEVTGETYGPLKVLCEKAVEAALPGRTVNVRSGLIVGPHDPTDRFTYWVHTVAQGGDMIVPDKPDYAMQIIDVRDIAEWCIHTMETGQMGTYNVTGPDYPLTLEKIIETSKEISGCDTNIHWIDEQFLLENGIQPWGDFPLWIPSSSPEMLGIHHVNTGKARAAGLKFRALETTTRDTLDWDATHPDDYTFRAGIRPERQAELLKAWREKV